MNRRSLSGGWAVSSITESRFIGLEDATVTPLSTSFSIGHSLHKRTSLMPRNLITIAIRSTGRDKDRHSFTGQRRGNGLNIVVGHVGKAYEAEYRTAT